MTQLGDGDFDGEIEMTVAVSGAYRSLTDPHKVRIITDQKHVIKLDGEAGTASISMGKNEYEKKCTNSALRHTLVVRPSPTQIA